jgi:hypothetical protein
VTEPDPQELAERLAVLEALAEPGRLLAERDQAIRERDAALDDVRVLRMALYQREWNNSPPSPPLFRILDDRGPRPRKFPTLMTRRA